MSPHERDDLSRLFSDTVDDIEPAHGLDVIRARTAQKESPMDHARNWMLGALGAAVATAAVITGVVLVGGDATTTGEDPDPAGSPSQSVVSDSPSETPTTTPPTTASPPTTAAPPPAGGDGKLVGTYWVDDTPFGPRLYREFAVNDTEPEPLDFAIGTILDGSPADPDYRSGWPAAASYASTSWDGDVITVDLTGDLHDRPAGMTVAEADMAIEQLIYTAQAAVQEGRVAVQLLLNGSRTDQVLGQPASEPLANGPILETLSHVSLTTPVEGQAVSGTIAISGVANSFEANVLIQLKRVGSDEVVLEDFATAEGYMDEKLFPFEKQLDVSGVAPGRYLLVASTDDASGQGRFYTDTRTVVVE